MTRSGREAWWEEISSNSEALSASSASVTEYVEHVAAEHAQPLLALGWPLSMLTGQGDHLQEVSTDQYTDLRSGGGVFPFGHRPKKITSALVDALAELDIGDWQLPSPHRTRFARQLSATMLDGTWQWRFFTSGSEGNEFALRTALLATKREKIVALRGGYHGQTGLAAAVTDQIHLGREYPRMALEVVRVAPDDLSTMETSLHGAAALILEPVQLSVSVRPMQTDFLRSARELCDKTGSVLIFDEVKCGLNRTGPLWAHHVAGVMPDLLVAGKALSGGVYPVTAVGIRKDTSNSFLLEHSHDARSSFGGSHLAMAVGCAALGELTDPSRRACFLRNGESFEEELRRALSVIPKSRVELRRVGMAFEIDVHDDDMALFLASDLLHRRVIVPFPKRSSIVLLPPLTISAGAMKLAAECVAASVSSGLMALGGLISIPSGSSQHQGR